MKIESLTHALKGLKGNLLSALSLVSLILCFCCVISISVAFLMYGTTLIFSELFGGKDWAAYLTTGALFLIITFTSFKLALRPKREKVPSPSASEAHHSDGSEKSFWDLIDMKKVVESYPLYSAGAAIAAGYMMAGTAFKSKKSKTPSAFESLILSAVFPIAQSIIRENLTPCIMDFFTSMKKEASETAAS